MLIALSRQPVAPMVCPTEDGEVSVYFKAPGRRGALHLLFDNDDWETSGPPLRIWYGAPPRVKSRTSAGPSGSGR